MDKKDKNQPLFRLDPAFDRFLEQAKSVNSLDDLANLSIGNIKEQMQKEQEDKIEKQIEKKIEEEQAASINSTLESSNKSYKNIKEADFKAMLKTTSFSKPSSLMQVAPSILSADFLNLQSEIESIKDADLLHIDIMDGHFVPNLTIGPFILENLYKITNLELDIHLMVEDTSFFIDLYAPLRPKYISIHLEKEAHVNRLIQKIRSFGISPSIALNPHTDISLLKYILQDIDMVLIMSVNPGFGGQQFIPSMLQKIIDLKELSSIYNKNLKIEVDGGVNDKNILDLKNAGVDIVVAGSYIFNASNKKDAINSLRV